MNNKDLLEIKNQLISITKDVGEYINNEQKKLSSNDIEEKEKNSLVSYVDKTAEQMLVASLQKLIPEAGFITEEKMVSQEKKDIQWIIDPLDGTTNYIFGLPHYSTSIALSINDEIVLGVVNDCAKQECFHAIKNEGAYLDDRKLVITKRPEMSNALFVTGFPYTNDYNSTKYLAIINELLKQSRGVRRYGSAALDLCYVAADRFTCYYEGFLNIWDIAAGALIVSEAGGIMRDLKGREKFLELGEVIAANPSIYDEVQKIISDKLG